MKIALGEIRMMKDPMRALLEKELPLKVSWRLNKLVKAFDKELQGIEDGRVSLVKKYGVEDDTKNVRVPEDKMPSFIQEFNEFLSEEVEFEFEPISVDVIGDVNISAKDLMVLDKLFV